MTEISSIVKADFDRIAPLSKDSWGHNAHYHNLLLKQIPASLESALDVGCGTGTFSRLLAQRSNHIVALDLSQRMIEIARERSRLFSNIEFQEADVTKWAFPFEAFDCIASIATLHHLPIEDTLIKMKSALRAGGILVILDLYQSVGWHEKLAGIVAFPVSGVLRLIRTGRLREPRQVRSAWAEHGRNDIYPAITKVRQICEKILPGAEVRKHLLWRYSIVWRKSA